MTKSRYNDSHPQDYSALASERRLERNELSFETRLRTFPLNKEDVLP